MGLRIVLPWHRAAVVALCLGLVSCSATGVGSPDIGRAITASDRIEVVDNFGAPDLEQHFQDIAAKVSSSVVAISATDSAVEAEATLHSDDLNPDRLAGILDTVDRTVGTGFVIDSDGYILTNDHVIANSEQLWVTTDSHKVYPAIVVGTDPRADLAVLKVPAKDLPVAHFATNPTRRGQWTIAIGNPYGLAGGGDMSVSVGIVSALNRSLPRLSGKEDRLYSGLIQTTAQINPGNSGGPLFNLNGEVVGINTAVILPQKQTNGIGFAIPFDARVRRIVENLKQGHEVVYGYLGVRVSTATPRELRDARLDENAGGVRIDAVENDSPAQAAKLKTGDIITQLDGETVQDSDDFVRLVGMCPVGKPVPAVIYRTGAIKASIKLRSRPTPPQTVTRESQRFRWRGMLLGPIPAGWDFGAAKKPLAGVMVIGIDAKSPMTGDGIKAGSVITAVAGRAIHTIAELQQIINDTPGSKCRVDAANPPSAVLAAN
jgi:S1-C subfamily serine protease